MKKILFFFLFCLGIGQIVQAANPRVNLDMVYDIGLLKATADITIINDSSLSIGFKYGVCYSSTNTVPTISDSKAAGNGGYNVGDLSRFVSRTVSLSSLTAGTTYYMRAYITNQSTNTTTYGIVNTLKTPLSTPGVTVINKTIGTRYAKNITSADARLEGSFYMQVNNTSSTSEEHTSRYGMCWSSSNAVPTTANSTYYEATPGFTSVYGDGNSSGDLFNIYPSVVSSLTPNTTYYARAYCIIDDVTTYYGDVITFKTLGAPTVTTSTVNSTSISTITATGGGNVTNLGNPASLTAFGVCWSSTATTPTTSNSKVSNGTKTTTGPFTSSMAGLTPGATYYVRAYATNSTGTSYGSVVSFKTLAAPTVTTAAAAYVTTATATGNGNITNLGNPASVSAYGVCWSSSNKVPTILDGHVTNGSITTTGAFTSSITGLSEKTTYYVRAYATNTTGTSYGDTVRFTTSSILPKSISYTTPNSFPVGTAITALSPTVVGGMPITGYSVSPALPAGLSINATTGVISGTPIIGTDAADYTVTATNSGGSISTVVNITVTSLTKQLSIKAYLEGVWNGANMNQCKDASGTPVFPSAVDTVTVELHSSSSYSTIVYSIHDVLIGQDGNFYSDSLSYIKMPSSYSGSYYITVKTRNHLATTSASAVSFAGNSISYDFTTAANKAYGSNMKLIATGIYGFYAGDVNQDGAINSVDGTTVNDSVNNFTTGYLPEDLNGDGSVDVSDSSIVENNDNSSISVSHP